MDLSVPSYFYYTMVLSNVFPILRLKLGEDGFAWTVLALTTGLAGDTFMTGRRLICMGGEDGFCGTP